MEVRHLIERSTRNQICILIPYFGKFPKSFDLYLYSCSKQKIDFYYLTDCKIPKKTYSNTFFIKMSFLEYCQLVSKKLDVDFYPKRTYKLCDIRPFLQFIHKDIVSQYDFWGWADVDLIYGDTSEFLSPENLSKYNLITSHSERIAGHFTIIRTNSRYAKLGYKIPNWKSLIASEINKGMDEGAFSVVANPYFRYITFVWYHFYKNFKNEDYKYDFYQRCQNFIHHFAMKDALFLEEYTSPIPKQGQVWEYNVKASTIQCPDNFYANKYLANRPLPYLHFIFFKKTKYLKTENYWSNDFWQVPSDYDYNYGGVVEISNKWVRLRKNEMCQ